MTKRIALFNHKGGVSKTITTFHLGWMLAERGYRVIVADADPQCNLSGLILGFKGAPEFEKFYEEESQRNIRAGLAPAFESQPRAIEPIDCLQVPGREGLFLLPGHLRFAEYEVTLGIAQELSGSIQTLQNLPGSLSYLLEVTAEHHEADFVLIDMNPSLSSINQNLLMTSDFFLLPTSPDYFSVMAIESLSSIIPRWHGWAEKAKKSHVLQTATYPYPDRNPKFLGTIIQKFRPRKGAPTIGFQKWIDTINARVSDRLVNTLEPLGMLLANEHYTQAMDSGKLPGLYPDLCLAQIPDFNTLIAKSQENKVPVFALTDQQLANVGTVLEADQGKREEFYLVFSELSGRVSTLTDHAESN